MNPPAEMRVRGSAHRELAPDYAVAQVSIAVRDDDRSAALAAVKAQLATFREAVEGHDDIRSSRMSSIRVTENYEWNPKTNTQEQRGWIASVNGSVEADTESVPEVIGRIADTGAQIGYVDWRLDVANPVYREVRKEAVADAVRAAEDFAAALGRQVGDLRVLADSGLLGGESPTSPAPMMARAMSSDMAGAGPIDIDPAPQFVTASVEATFALQ